MVQSPQYLGSTGGKAPDLYEGKQCMQYIVVVRNAVWYLYLYDTQIMCKSVWNKVK